ncbi:acyltransferase family protein [Ruminococcus sp.]|uniref:acyltransferase family protein n=1 Tax=Ruminococcus sp. TaxID=41978 RepID=UPI00388D01A0
MVSNRKTFNLFSISEARNVIFGIATLWIGLFHCDNLTLATFTDNQFLIDAFKFFRGSGNIGVDMFLFLSGIGLYFSFKKDSNLLHFWKKRLMRVLPTALFIAMFYFSFRYVNGRYESGWKTYLRRVSFLYFFEKGERVFWFISLILVLYLLFPVFYKVIEKYRLVGMLGLVAVTVGLTFLLRQFAPTFYGYWEIALCRVPTFIIGIWAGKFVLEKKEINRNWLWLFLIIVIGMSTLMYFYTPIMQSLVKGYNKSMEAMWIWFYRYTGAVIGIFLVILDSFVCTSLRHKGRCNLLRNFFEFVGMYSLEYYMIFLNVNHYLERIYEVQPKHEFMLYLGSFFVSLALCVVVRKLCDFFMNYMQRKPKNLAELKAARKAAKLAKKAK